MRTSATQAALPATEIGVPSASNKTSHFPFSAVSSAALMVATGLGMVACGGGGGGGVSPSSPATVSLSGQAVKGPVIGGQVCAYTLETPRKQIACATTDASATYSLALPVGTGEVLLEVTGGSYIDEATSQKVALSSPLRALSKAGSADNALITPFTELAVQRATVTNPGGNLTLVGFQTQIGQLETGLGITGLATGNPFGGKSGADITHQKALEAFAKQQNSLGKTVGGTLQLIGSEIDKCGIAGVGTTLAIFGALGVTTTAGAGGNVLIKAASSIAAPDFILNGDNVTIDTVLPSLCMDGVNIDGDIQPLMVLDKASPPTSWLTAKSVQVTQCTGYPRGNWNFPQAKVIVHAQSLHFPNGVTVNSLGNYNLSSIAQPIDLNKSGISLNTATGCLLPSSNITLGSGRGSFNALSIVSSTVASGGGGTLANGAGGNVVINNSGVGTVSSGGGVVVTGGSNGSGSGGVTVSGKTN